MSTEIKSKDFDDEFYNFQEYFPNEVIMKHNVFLDGYRMIKTIVKKKESIEIDLGYVCYPTMIFSDSEGNKKVLIKYYKKNEDGFVDIILDSSSLQSSRFCEDLAQKGYMVDVPPEYKTHFKELMVSLYTYLNNNQKEIKTFDQMGWHGREFVIGDKLIKQDGSLSILNQAGKLKNIAEEYKTKGSYEKSKEALNVLLSNDEYFTHSTAFLLAIASPLFKFQLLNGCAMNLYSKESGSGKSLVQLFVQGFYSDINKKCGDYTYLVTSNISGKIQNLPLVIDEVTEKLNEIKTQAEIKRIIYNHTLGITKAGSTSDGDVRKTYNFNNCIFFSSNKSIKFLIDKSVAQQSRLYEVEIIGKKTEKQIKELVDAYMIFNDNHGHGYVVLQNIVKNQDKIKEQINFYYNHFASKFVDTNYRFISTMFASAVVMAQIMEKMGYKVNPAKVLAHFESEVARVMVDIEGSYLTANYILEEYVFAHKHSIRQASKLGMKYNPTDDRQPDIHDALLIINQNELRISKKSFDNFLKTNPNITSNYKEIKRYFDQENIEIEEKKALINNMSVSCYIIQLPKEFLGGVETGLRLVKDEPIPENIINSFGT